MLPDFEKLTYVDGETVIPAKNLNDIQDAILALDERTEEENPNVLVALYGTTTFDTLMSAYNDGKTIFARDSETDYNLSDITRQDDTVTAFQFSSFRVIDGTKYLYTCECDATNGWSSEVQQIELSEELLEPVEQTIKPTTLGPAAIATFDASAADMPLKGLAVDIEPVQDLHGYDHPWPGGGGKNLIPFNAQAITENGITFTPNSDGTITVNGTASANANYFFVGTSNEYVAHDIPPGDYILSGGLSNVYLYVTAQNKPVIADQGTPQAVAIEDGDLLRIFLRVVSGRTVSNLVVKPMLRRATETDDTFEPYANICPISGWTGCNVTRTGKLPYDERLYPMTRDKIINASTGDPANSGANNCASGFVPISDFQGKTLRLNHRPTGASGGIAFYDADRNYIPDSGLANNNAPVGTSWDFDVPATAIYMRFTSHNDYIGHISVVVIAETQEIPITFPSPDPGTVYGGTLDVVGKKLTVDRVAVGMETLTWTNPGENRYRAAPPNLPIADARTLEILCTCYKSNIGGDAFEDKTIYNVNDTIYVVDTAFGSLLTPFRESIVGQTVVYPLATPIVYDLSDIPEITTLLGTNNIWADTGDVTVTYGAYLETVKAHAERLGDSILSAIAPLETTYTASRAYAVGEFLFVGTKFYKVVSAIAEGGTITPETNVTQTTVAEMLTNAAFKFVQNLESVTVAAGELAVFIVEVNQAAHYQWQWRRSESGTWANITNGPDSPTNSFTMAASYAGRQYRCVANNGEVSLISNVATLSLAQ